jgi:hypothetical protein
MQFRTPKAVSIQVNDISVPVDLVDAFPTLLPGTICRKPIWWQKHAKAMVDFCLVCLNPNEFRIDLIYPSDRFHEYLEIQTVFQPVQWRQFGHSPRMLSLIQGQLNLCSKIVGFYRVAINHHDLEPLLFGGGFYIYIRYVLVGDVTGIYIYTVFKLTWLN